VLVTDRTGELRRQLLAELDTPLIERVDVPDDALHEHLVLVERDELTQRRGIDALGQNQRARPVAGIAAVRITRTLVRSTLGKREHLREAIGRGEIVLVLPLHGRAGRQNEVQGHTLSALMQQLKERVLRIGAGLAPDHRASRAFDGLAVAADRLAVALHLQLLQIGRQAMQMIVVRQHGMARRIEKIAVPDADEREQHRKAVGRVRRCEVLVNLMAAVQQLLEAHAPKREREAHAHGRPDRVPPADPIPDRETALRKDAERIHGRMVRRDRGELCGHGCLTALEEQPLAHGMRIRERLERRESLRADDEQSPSRVDLLEHMFDLHAVDVGDEVQADAIAAVIDQGFRGHNEAKIGTADADVDDVGDRLPREALELMSVEPIGEVEHLLTFALYERHDVLAVEEQRAVGRPPERDVQGRTVLGTVDMLAREHGLDPGRYLGLLGELDQARHRLLV